MKTCILKIVLQFLFFLKNFSNGEIYYKLFVKTAANFYFIIRFLKMGLSPQTKIVLSINSMQIFEYRTSLTNLPYQFVIISCNCPYN